MPKCPHWEYNNDLMEYSKANGNFTAKLTKLITPAQSVLLTTHRDPDDDSIGSILSAYYLLKKIYPDKFIRMLLKGPVDDRWSYFAGFDQIKIVDDAVNHLNRFDLVIFVDQSQYSMITDYPQKLADYKGKTVSIDHHATAPSKFDLLLRDPSATSATELIYDVFCRDGKYLDKKLAEILLLGILGDTGNLGFVPPSKLAIFSLVQKLLKIADTRIDDIRAKAGMFPTELIPAFSGFVQNARLKNIPGWPQFLTSFIPLGLLGESDDGTVKKASSFFIAFFGTGVKEASWSIVALPLKNGDVIIRLRSQINSVNVRHLMEGMGIGGGHNRAAGGLFKADGKAEDPEKCLEKIMEWMRQHDPVIG